MQSVGTRGRTTFKTVGFRMYTEGGDSISDSSRLDEPAVLEGSPFFLGGSISGAVVVLLGSDGLPSSSEVVVESPHGQDDLETIDRGIAQLTWMRDTLRQTVRA